jgi:hypothetical protein
MRLPSHVIRTRWQHGGRRSLQLLAPGAVYRLFVDFQLSVNRQTFFLTFRYSGHLVVLSEIPSTEFDCQVPFD